MSWPTIFITCFLLLVQGGKIIVGKEWPKWMDVPNDVDTLGDLCDSENDGIGRKLGCDCRYPVMTPGQNLYADCSAQTLGTENSELPPRINVSLHVRRLLFNDNYLTALTEETFGRIDGVTEASFARNRIEVVGRIAFGRLGTLDLSHNSLRNLSSDTFKNTLKIERLDLSYNELSFIETETFSHLLYLRVLNLGSNQIGVAAELMDEYPFQLQHLERLEDIDLSNNSLQDFPSSILQGSDHIKKLNLRNNRILHIPPGDFLELENLEVLDLSGNLLTVLHANSFQGLANLHVLLIDGNNDLILIEEHAFAGLTSLKEFSCQRNHRLAAIDPSAFKGNKAAETNDSSPTTVRLGDNALTYFDEELLDWKNLQYLDLIRNPWICDCNLQWVALFREQNSAEAAILIDPDFKCASPETLKHNAVATLDAGELMCYSSAATTLGIVAIVLFCSILVTFCTIIGLNAFGLLPKSFQKLNVFGQFHSLPKYVRVRARSTGSCNSEPPPADLEWDNADVGR